MDFINFITACLTPKTNLDRAKDAFNKLDRVGNVNKAIKGMCRILESGSHPLRHDVEKAVTTGYSIQHIFASDDVNRKKLLKFVEDYVQYLNRNDAGMYQLRVLEGNVYCVFIEGRQLTAAYIRRLERQA